MDGVEIFSHDVSGKQLHGSHSLTALMVAVAACGLSWPDEGGLVLSG
jgi:hypothetical protein